MATHETENRVAIVTGAARGIGAGVAEALVASGLRVVLSDIDATGIAREAERLGPRARAFAADVSDETSVQELFARSVRAFGSTSEPISVLIQAAGVLLLPGGVRPLIHEMSLDNWERSFAVNTRGAFLCAREFLRAANAPGAAPMGHGRIVLFGSVAAQLGGYRSSASYIAAKSAVMGLAKALARESAHLGITANAIAPGLIDTEMLRATVRSSGDLDAAARSIPLGRIGTIADVTAAVSYLVSPQAAYQTGTVIDVNGGYRMQ